MGTFVLIAYGMTLIFMYRFTELKLQHRQFMAREELRALPDPNRELDLEIAKEKTKQNEYLFSAK